MIYILTVWSPLLMQNKCCSMQWRLYHWQIVCATYFDFIKLDGININHLAHIVYCFGHITNTSINQTHHSTISISQTKQSQNRLAQCYYHLYICPKTSIQNNWNNSNATKKTWVFPVCVDACKHNMSSTILKLFGKEPFETL